MTKIKAKVVVPIVFEVEAEPGKAHAARTKVYNAVYNQLKNLSVDVEGQQVAPEMDGTEYVRLKEGNPRRLTVEYVDMIISGSLEGKRKKLTVEQLERLADARAEGYHQRPKEKPLHRTVEGYKVIRHEIIRNGDEWGHEYTERFIIRGLRAAKVLRKELRDTDDGYYYSPHVTIGGKEYIDYQPSYDDNMTGQCFTHVWIKTTKGGNTVVEVDHEVDQ